MLARARAVAWLAFGPALGGVAVAVALNILWGWPAARAEVPDGPRWYSEAMGRLLDELGSPPWRARTVFDDDWPGYSNAVALGMIAGLPAGLVAARLTRKEQRWNT